MKKPALSVLSFPVFSAGLALLSFASTAASAAQTISAKRIAATQRLTPLTKITIGPDDQYDASLTSDGGALIFTRKADLISRLHAQDIQTGEVINLLPVNYDSADASPSPDGRMAFTYFKASARGDICYGPQPKPPLKSMGENDIQCLQRTSSGPSPVLNTQRSNPFWVSTNEIGFLERDIQSSQSRVVVQNIKTNASRTLVDGRIWSPTMRMNGRYLAYNEVISAEASADRNKENESRRLTLLDLTNHKKYSVRLDLPGITGFPAFSFDEGQLYFSHFLNDTNNDRAIDGTDNAVVFRLPVAKIISAAQNVAVFPEQLTSAETSCSFPRPAQQSKNHDLYVTCAFEGSLDIYRIPDTGVVPLAWDAKRLANALQTSRSYQDRILILNTTRSRAPLFGPKETHEFAERLLSNHMFADDTVASQFYLQKLADVATPAEKNFWSLMQLILEAHDLKMSQPTVTVTREFRRQLEDLEGRAQKFKSEPTLFATAVGLLRLYGERLQEAEKYRQQSRPSKSGGATPRPFELYVRFELANQLYKRDLPRSLKPLLEAHREMMTAAGLTAESQLYYAVSALRVLQENEARIPQRLSLIATLQKDLTGSVATLIQSESAVLRLIEAPEEKKMVAYREVDQLMSQKSGLFFA